MADTSVSYKCPNCGAPLSYLPGDDHVTCEYCGSTFETSTIEKLFAKAQERAAEAERKQEAKWETEKAGNTWSEEEREGMQVFTCSSCGAELVADANTMATECCYCGNPTMIPSRFDGELKPDRIIPFQKTKEDAVASLKAFYEGKRLLPDAFRKGNRVEDVQAMYVPFWLFDADVSAEATFRAERVRRYERGDEIITETKYYDCYRAGDMSFRRIPVDGSQKMDDAFMESIEPFDYHGLKPFSPAYLTGALADRYDVDAEASVPRADERIAGSAAELLEKTVEDYDSVSINGDPTVHKESGDVTYAMAPVWILTTRYQNEPYTFMMNGQTGQMAGRLPYDNVKSYLYLAGSAVISLPILYAIIYAACWAEDVLSESTGLFALPILIVSVIAAVLVGVAVRQALIKEMDNVHFAGSGNEYLKKNTFRLTDEDDTYLYSDVTRVKKSSKDHS